MKSNSNIFNQFNQASLKDLRLVVKIGYSTPLYFTSHAGIPSIPANRIDDVLRDVSSTSQRLIPDEGRSDIGSMSFSVIDVDGDVTTEFRTQQTAGEGLKGLTVELYRGGAGMDWTDFRLEQTQQIDRDVILLKGAYRIQCADIQREMRKDIYDLAKTKLSAELAAGATTLSVFDTTDFEACSHVASFGDSPTGSYYYLKIKYKNGFEIVKATGKTATTFTGLTRGMFGTDDVTHVLPSGSDADSGVEVEEYVYLELPAPAMAYALLTGNIIGGGTIPANWNLGISTSLVGQPSFEDIGEDWFDSSDYTKGLIFRFQALKKTDGKRFIEREVCLLAGAFLRVGADGKLYMQRMTGVIESADHVLQIGVDNAIVHGAIKHDLTKVLNTFDIEWSYIDLPGETKPRFVRRNILLDATSIAIHGESKPLALQFKGLHNERHTYTTLINRFDALRDRYAGPPITFPVDLLPALNDLEVGDIVRAVFPNVRDFTATGTLDRACEIQRITINQNTGRVTAQLFGSTSKAEPIADTGAGVNSELPNGWYSATGTEMGTLLTIDGSGVMTANGTLNGGTTTRTVFYYLGDFTVQTGVTLTVTGNVELRIRGHLQINGKIESTTGFASDTAGFIGTTYGGRGVLIGNGPRVEFAADRVVGRHSAMPVLEIENNAGSIVGIPADMRGSGGGLGGDYKSWDVSSYVADAFGGAGGAGGGSVVMVSRGAGYGVSGETDVSGADGSTGGIFGPDAAGSGGGGSPGCAYHLLDGSGVTFPILAGNIRAEYGTSPVTNSDANTQGKAAATIDLGVSNARVAYVPASRDPYPDYTNTNIGAQSTFAASVYQRSATAPATPTADDGSYNFATQTLTPPTGWSVTPPATDGNPLYVSSGLFQVPAGDTVDNTVTWSAPAILVDDGLSVYVANVYKRSASAPATPSADDGQYNFTTKTLTPPTGWSIAPPAGSDPLYVSTGSFSIVGQTGIDTTVTWTSPDLLVQDGATGAAGADGDDGLSVHVANVYKRSASAPSTPSADDGQYNFTTKTLTPPTGWSVAPPAGSDPLYVSTGSFSIIGQTGTDTTVTWTAPDLLVSDGVSAVVSQLTNPSVVVAADNDGTNYSLASAGGTHQAFEGATDVTTSAVHSVVGSATKNGLTIAVVSGTGVYSLSGASWTTDEENFTLRAAYGGNNYDKIYNIAKAKSAPVARINPIGANLSDSSISPADAAVGFKVDSDGDIYTYTSPAKSYASIGTWLGSGVVGNYEVMVTGTGTPVDPAGSALETWLACSSDRAWTYEITGIGEDTLAATVKWRDASTFELLGEASLDLHDLVEL